MRLVVFYFKYTGMDFVRISPTSKSSISLLPISVSLTLFTDLPLYFYLHNHLLKTTVMNAELFKRLLQVEAENLYQQGSTPESFMNRINPLIQELLKESRSETMSENDLEGILVSSKSKANQNSNNRNCFFDVVDLSMYRAN